MKDKILEYSWEVFMNSRHEIRKAIEKHGEQLDISIDRQFMIKAEEHGEIAMAINDENYNNALLEIEQDIAMSIKLHYVIRKSIDTDTSTSNED